MTITSSSFCFLVVAVLGAVTCVCATPPSIPFGAAISYGVVAASLVSNAGQSGTVINGNIAASTVTGFVGIDSGSGVCNGQIQVANSISQGALAAGSIAYQTARNASCNNITSSVPQELGGLTLTPGVYCNSLSASQITGHLTLAGPAGSEWIFQLPGAFTAESGSQVIFSGGANACGVFWVVVSAAIDSTAAFQGSVLAAAQIAVKSSASVQGRLISVGAGVSFIGNALTLPSCNGTELLSSSTGSSAVSSSSGVASSSSAGAGSSSSGDQHVSSSSGAAISSSSTGIALSTGTSGAGVLVPSLVLLLAFVSALFSLLF